MTYLPRARVLVSSLDGSSQVSGVSRERPALVVSKVKDVDAYTVRYGDHTRAVVNGSQLKPNTKGEDR